MKTKSLSNLGFEEKLFKAADKLRKNMDAAEYKHVVLGLIFLKYVSDAFQHRRQQLEQELNRPESGIADNPQAKERTLEDRHEYAGENILWVPNQSRWQTLRNNATQPDIAERTVRGTQEAAKESPNLKATFGKDQVRNPSTAVSPEN